MTAEYSLEQMQTDARHALEVVRQASRDGDYDTVLRGIRALRLSKGAARRYLPEKVINEAALNGDVEMVRDGLSALQLSTKKAKKYMLRAYVYQRDRQIRESYRRS